MKDTPIEKLFTKYGILVNITRNEKQEKEFQEIYNELNRRL